MSNFKFEHLKNHRHNQYGHDQISDNEINRLISAFLNEEKDWLHADPMDFYNFLQQFSSSETGIEGNQKYTVLNPLFLGMQPVDENSNRAVCIAILNYFRSIMVESKEVYLALQKVFGCE